MQRIISILLKLFRSLQFLYTACRKGTYKPTISNNLCVRCPQYSIAKSTGMSKCTCMSNFFRSNNLQFKTPCSSQYLLLICMIHQLKSLVIVMLLTFLILKSLRYFVQKKSNSCFFLNFYNYQQMLYKKNIYLYVYIN